MAEHTDDVTEEKLESGFLNPHSNQVQLETSPSGSQRVMKVLSLLLLTPHYAVLILLMRYVRTRPGPLFLTSTTVVMTEAVKTVTCLLALLVQEGGVGAWVGLVWEHTGGRPRELARVGLPSLLFVLQNNLVFFALSNLDAATFQVTYQLKILTTAVFSVLLLGKQLKAVQWVALLLLFAGVSTIQVHSARASSVTRSGGPQPANVTSSEWGDDVTQSPLTGLAAVLACSCLSGFASVFFELLLKGGKQSVWLLNVQLGLSGVVLASLACLLHDGPKLASQGFFFAYDGLVWTVVLMQSLGGLLVAAVIKYADNILKGFSTAGSIVLSCLASTYMFHFQMDGQFLVGTGLVLCAVYLYTVFQTTLTLPTVDTEVKAPSPAKVKDGGPKVTCMP